MTRWSVLGVLLALAVLLVATAAPTTEAGRGRRERRETITVIDRTGPKWDGYLAAAVADLKAHMPPRGPRLRYERAAHRVCAADVETCSGPIDVRYGGYATWTHPGHGHAAFSDRHRLTPEERANIACHELMHVLTGQGDRYTRNPDGTITWWEPGADSCLWGERPSVGSVDAQLLRETWGGKKAKKKRRN